MRNKSIPKSSQERSIEFRKRNKERYALMGKQWQEKNPEKKKAHLAVQYAVKSGKIIKPIVCEKCNVAKRLEGHHPDYSKPLDVMWLCRSCHRAEHGKVAPSANKRLVTGVKHHFAKLNPSKVREIRKLLGERKMFQKDIAKMFGVSPELIGFIKKGTIWKEVV